MGLSGCWIAIEGGGIEALLEAFGLEEAGSASEEWADGLSAAVMPTGWAVLATPDGEGSLGAQLEAAPRDRSVIGCEFSETVTFSRLIGRVHGRDVWSVTYDPDRGGLIVDGTPPSALAEIRHRLEVEEAQEAGVAWGFDAPVELGHAICGYNPWRPSGLEWTLVRAKRPEGPKRSGSRRRRRSMATAIREELASALEERGWRVGGTEGQVGGRPGLFEFFRDLDGQKQMIWLEFGGGDYPFVEVHFNAFGRGEQAGLLIRGEICAPEIPWWRRFTLRRFLQVTAYHPRPADPVAIAIQKGLRDALIAHDFLDRGERHPRVCVGLGSAAASWPDIPDPP